MSQEFVPVTTELTDPSFVASPAGRWFKRISDAHKEPKATDQGFYILTADGYGPKRLFGYPDWYAPGVLKFMDAGLAMVKGHSVSTAGLTPARVETPSLIQPDATTSVIQEFSRMPDAGRSELNSSPDRDQLWIYQDEVQDLVEQARQAGRREFSMPITFASRMARFHLIDDIGGRATIFDGPNHVRRAEFTARMTGVTNGHVQFAFIGSWACGTEDNTIGIEGTIHGEFEVDAAQYRIVKFRAYADANAWGGGNPGHTEMPPKGKFRLVFAFIEATDARIRSIPPSSAYMVEYRDAWSGLTPVVRH